MFHWPLNISRHSIWHSGQHSVFRTIFRMIFKTCHFSFQSLTFVDVKLVKDSTRLVVDNREKQSEILWKYLNPFILIFYYTQLSQWDVSLLWTNHRPVLSRSLQTAPPSTTQHTEYSCSPKCYFCSVSTQDIFRARLQMLLFKLKWTKKDRWK